MVHSGARASIPTENRHGAVLAMLEAATEGSQHLDDSVVITATDGEMMDWWDEAAQQHVIKAGDGSRVNVTPVTTSLDAALALAERVLPGHWFSISGGGSRWSATIKDSEGGGVYWFGDGPSPALALCLAALKASL